jgi:hypothetical protein
MKMLMTLAVSLILSLALSAVAQTAAIKDIPTEGDTTISISKGKNNQNEYQITDGTAEIAGEPEAMTKAARASWKQECTEWKKEIKEMNKDNQVLALTCNSPTCTKNGTSETVCASQGTYKLKTKVR